MANSHSGSFCILHVSPHCNSPDITAECFILISFPPSLRCSMRWVNLCQESIIATISWPLSSVGVTFMSHDDADARRYSFKKLIPNYSFRDVSTSESAVLVNSKHFNATNRHLCGILWIFCTLSRFDFPAARCSWSLDRSIILDVGGVSECIIK